MCRCQLAAIPRPSTPGDGGACGRRHRQPVLLVHTLSRLPCTRIPDCVQAGAGVSCRASALGCSQQRQAAIPRPSPPGDGGRVGALSLGRRTLMSSLKLRSEGGIMNSRWPACVIILASAHSVGFSDDVPPTVRPISEADAVVAMYTQDWRLLSSGRCELILAIWGDGHVVWSKDLRRGGSPYFSGELDRNRLSSLLVHLRNDRVFSNGALSRPYIEVDHRFTTLLVRDGQAVLQMHSRHEFDENGEDAAAINDRVTSPVPRAQSAQYLHFRRVWSEIRQCASGLIPDKRVPTDGRLLVRGGVVSWLEQSDSRNTSAGEGDRRPQKEQGATPQADDGTGAAEARE